MIVSPLTAVVLELPWDCRQSNLSSASALGAINQLQQGMNFHSENNFKASECKEVWKYQRKAFTYTASAWTPNHWIVRKSGFTLPSALHLGFIFSQKAFFSRSSHSKEKANWGLGYCWTWWITSSLSQRAGGVHCLNDAQSKCVKQAPASGKRKALPKMNSHIFN